MDDAGKWLYLNFLKSRNIPHRREFSFDLTNDLMMYILAKLSSYPVNPPTCTSITAIKSIECSLRFLGRFKYSSTQNCFGPGSFFVSVPSPARAHNAQWLIPIWAAVAEYLQFGVPYSGAGELLAKRTGLPNAPDSSEFINV